MQDIYIYNATDKTVCTRAFGNYFDFPAKSVKRLRKEMGEFIAENKAQYGLVAVPESMSDQNKVELDGKLCLYRETPEGKAQMDVFHAQAIANRVASLTAQINNLKISLAKDLAGAELKIDPLILATDADEAAMEELATYQRADEDKQKAKVERIKKLDRQLLAQSNGLANKKA